MGHPVNQEFFSRVFTSLHTCEFSSSFQLLHLISSSEIKFGHLRDIKMHKSEFSDFKRLVNLHFERSCLYLYENLGIILCESPF